MEIEPKQEVMMEDNRELPLEAPTAAEEFTPKQLQALAALAAGSSVTGAAKAAEVDRSTVHRWLQDAAFVSERSRLVQERRDAFNAQVVRIGGKALETLEELLDAYYLNERDRVAAVSLACKIAGLGRPAKKGKKGKKRGKDHKAPDGEVR